MTKVTIESGICGFVTTITAESDDGQMVNLKVDSDCPNVQKLGDDLATIDAYAEIFTKPQDSTITKTLSAILPHISCPVYCGFYKAVEVGAGLALPKDAHIKIERPE